MGVAALFLLILAAGRMILALRRSADPRIRGFGLGMLGAGIALLVSNLFDVTFVDPKTSMLAWTILGVEEVRDEQRDPRSQNPQPEARMRGSADRRSARICVPPRG